jgi:hypothetical protein
MDSANKDWNGFEEFDMLADPTDERELRGNGAGHHKVALKVTYDFIGQAIETSGRANDPTLDSMPGAF